TPLLLAQRRARTTVRATDPERALRINEPGARLVLRLHKDPGGDVRGEPQHEAAAAARPRGVFERTTLQLRQAPRDRKPQARAAAVCRSAGRAVERLEDAVP